MDETAPDNQFTLDEVRTLWFDGADGAASGEPGLTLRRESATGAETGLTETASKGSTRLASRQVSMPGATITLRANRVVTLGGDELDASDPGDYQLGGKIGQGGMGVIVAAKQASLDRRVAVKMIRPDRHDEGSRFKFILEALATGSLEHPNVVPIYELGQDEDGNLFYAMKEVKGANWRKTMKDRQEKDNIETLCQVANAVAYAHAKGIIHRDIKSDNVMLGDFGEVMLMDWGLAVGMRPGTKAQPLTPDNALAGTPAYMAPEMARGNVADIGPWSDQYLLGAVLFEILTGNPPHPGKGVDECLKNAANNVMETTDRADEWIEVALRAMHANPVKRHPSVKDFIARIRECQSHGESLELSRLAGDWQCRARESGDYDQYLRAMTGFEQALELWDGNETARLEADKTRLAYAATALDRGDYDLSLSLAEKSSAPEAAELAQKAEKARRERDSRRRLVRWLGLAAGILLLVTAVVAGGAAVIVSRQAKAERLAREEAEKERRRAETALVETERQRGIAEEQRAAADAQRKRAEDALVETERQRKIAESERAVAVEQRAVADEQRKRAVDALAETERQRNIAESERAVAVEQRAVADEQRKRAEDALIEAERQRNIAESERARAEEQRAVADTQRKRAEEALVETERQRKIAESERAVAVEQRAVADEQRLRAETALAAAETARQAEARAMAERLREEQARAEAETAARIAAEEALAAREVVQRMGYLEDNTRWRMTPEQASELQRESARRHNAKTETALNLSGGNLEFSWIPAGDFVMGSPPRDSRRNPDEHLHEVRITKPFSISRFELTRGQWQAAVGVENLDLSGIAGLERITWAWRTAPVTADEGSLPATGISHREVEELLLPALRQRFGPAHVFRLPTEAEWEWAARAGATTAYASGEEVDALEQEGWFEENGDSTLHPVGRLKANAWGIYDASGNASELTADHYDPNFYLVSDRDDPLCLADTPMRTVRGGSFVSLAKQCRLASRSFAHRENRHPQVGFRLVLEPAAALKGQP